MNDLGFLVLIAGFVLVTGTLAWRMIQLEARVVELEEEVAFLDPGWMP